MMLSNQIYILHTYIASSPALFIPENLVTSPTKIAQEFGSSLTKYPNDVSPPESKVREVAIPMQLRKKAKVSRV